MAKDLRRRRRSLLSRLVPTRRRRGARRVEAALEKPLDFPRLIQTVNQVLANAVNSMDTA
jgi:hypothetical protein